MAKSVHNDVLDASHTKTATATRQVLCSGEPANFAGIAAVALADVTLDSGDFATADGDTSGRKVTIAAQTGVTIDSSGTATHVSLDDGTILLRVTTCSSQALTAAGTVDIGSWKCEIADPT